MPVYRLEPVEGLQNHQAWQASGIGMMVVWVRAKNPDEARRKVHLATLSTVAAFEAGELVPASSPWLNSALVDCDEDDAHPVPQGVALLGNGRTIPV
jgi:hypothetical protein